MLCVDIKVKVVKTSMGICHAYVYRLAKFEYHSLNTVRDIAVIVQVKNIVKFDTQL